MKLSSNYVYNSNNRYGMRNNTKFRNDIASATNPQNYKNNFPQQKIPVGYYAINAIQPSFCGKPPIGDAEYNILKRCICSSDSEYSGKILESFQKIFDNFSLDKDNFFVKDLMSSCHLTLGSKRYPGNKTFSLDFLLRTAEDFENVDIDTDCIINKLPKIKFPPKIASNVKKLLDTISEDLNFRNIGASMYPNAIANENIPLLKVLIEDMNWKFFKSFDDVQEHGSLKFINQVKESKNPKIISIFNDENIYKFLCSRNTNQTIDAIIERTPLSDIAMLRYNMELDKIKKQCFADKFMHILFTNRYLSDSEKIDCASNVAKTNYERFIEFGENYSIDSYCEQEYPLYIQQADKLRMDKIIQRNGFESQKDFLGCLKDTVMAPEMLTYPYKGEVLIEKIAKSKEIMPEIVDRLAQMDIADNMQTRQAAFIAAQNGHLDLLKVLTQKHVDISDCINNKHYFNKDIEDFLSTTKYSTSEITNIQEPNLLEYYLETHPNVNINSNPNGVSLLSNTIKNRNYSMLEYLEKRDDVDWNTTNYKGENAVFQIVDRYYNWVAEEEPDAFKTKLFKMLSELPKERFDINYINERTGEHIFDRYLNNPSNKNFIFDWLMKFPEIDTNKKLMSFKESMLERFADSPYFFEKIWNHPNTNTKSFAEKVKNREQRISLQVLKIMEDSFDKKILDKMKAIYDRDGTFTIDNIIEFMEYPNFDSIKNEPLNSIGEKIGHFLPELEETQKLSATLLKLSKKYDFNILDDIGRSALGKAVDMENYKAAEMLLSLSHPDDWDEIIEYVRRCGTPKMKEIFNDYI